MTQMAADEKGVRAPSLQHVILIRVDEGGDGFMWGL
jgi:hypothetical protein